MENLAVGRFLKVVRGLVDEKYLVDYSKEDIDVMMELAFDCLNVISENSNVDFEIRCDQWGDFTAIVKSYTRIENKLLTFNGEIYFNDDIIEIEINDKVIIDKVEVENKTRHDYFDILKYLLNR